MILYNIIKGEIIEINTVTLNEKNKQRYKFLHHLPDYTDVKFADIDMHKLLSSD